MKYYLLLTYNNNGSVENMVSFDFFNEIDNSIFKNKRIDKIKLFKINDTQDGRDIIKEYSFNKIDLDNTFKDPETKILGYEIIKDFTHSYYFRVKFEMSEELRKSEELWYRKRYIDFRLKQSKVNESPLDVRGGALSWE